MKAKKIFDGVWEFPSWKPEPIRERHDVKQYNGSPGWMREDARANRLRHVVTNAISCGEYPYYFGANYPEGNGTVKWHADGPMRVTGTSTLSTHVLVLIATNNPALGTVMSDCEKPVYGQLPDGARTFKCKTWTPYLFRSDIIHRSPPGPWDCSRLMYRIFLKLDEATLDNLTLSE
jgi:hypothetical protein